jgi:hypothetical protein
MSCPRFDSWLRLSLSLAACLLLCRSLAAQSTGPLPDANPQPPNAVANSNPAEVIKEDLSSLSLPPGLVAADPVPGGIKETPDYISQLYRLQWRANDPIDVFVIRPKGVSRPPVAIYLYGFPVDPDRFRNDEFCKMVTRGGVAAIGFNPALTAERYHDVPMRQWFISQLHDSIVKTVHDVQMIVNYAQSRPDLDGNRIGIFGQGSGATIAGLAAIADPRIQAVDLLDPWGDWPAWLAESKLVPEQERPGFLSPEFLEPLEPLDPVRWLPSLKGRALKLDDAVYEDETPPNAKQRINASLPPGALLVRYPTRSDFQKNALEDGHLVSWIKDRLGSQSAADVQPPRLSPKPVAASAGQPLPLNPEPTRVDKRPQPPVTPSSSLSTRWKPKYGSEDLAP